MYSPKSMNFCFTKSKASTKLCLTASLTFWNGSSNLSIIDLPKPPKKLTINNGTANIILAILLNKSSTPPTKSPVNIFFMPFTKFTGILTKNSIALPRPSIIPTIKKSPNLNKKSIAGFIVVNKFLS